MLGRRSSVAHQLHHDLVQYLHLANPRDAQITQKDDEDEGYEKDDRAAQPGPTQWGIRQSDGKAAWASTSIDA